MNATWSNARSTFGAGTPQTGDRYDDSGTLRQLQSDLGAAAPRSRWTGSAASAYDTATTEHRRVIGELAGLDQRLKAHIDQSAGVVATGRGRLGRMGRPGPRHRWGPVWSRQAAPPRPGESDAANAGGQYGTFCRRGLGPSLSRLPTLRAVCLRWAC